MADELTPGQIRAHRFDLTRKGYDRGQVDAFLGEVADELQALGSSIEAESARDPDLGIEDPEALARELHRIGDEVSAVLEAARAAAEGMRTRATTDAESWRSDAETEAAELRSAAAEVSHALRASAWNEGTALLAAAVAEAQAIVSGAKEESLFVRAEAEREALRLTGDARRDREESIRSARLEADQILDVARQESDGVLAAARQQAEMAQDRARALEDRRSELLGELEAARAAIGELENEIESKKQELETPPEPDEPFDELTHHDEDGGSVRIVAPTRVVPLKPVDADELVAEVTALRSGLSSVPRLVEEDEPVTAVDAATTQSAPPSEPPPAIAEDTSVVAPAAPAPDDAPPERHDDVDESEDLVARDDDPPADHVPDPPSATTAAPASDVIGNLFAKLKDAGAADQSSPPQNLSSSVPPSANVAGEPTVEMPVGDSGAQSDDPTVDTPLDRVADENAPDDGALITAQNDALRTIKRTLVELQNEALEHLRSDAGWMPPSDFTDRFDEPFSTLAAAVGQGSIGPFGSSFGRDLHDAVSAAVDRTREGGAGDREVAAAVSKVFRMWRSDEAERRVADASSNLAGV